MSASPPCSIDEARTANPDLGFALYALEPGKPLTLEIHTPDGDYFTFVGASEAELLAKAFPPEEPALPEPEINIFD